MVKLAASLSFLLLVGCTDRTREIPPVVFEPPPEPVDMGRDEGTVLPDDHCDGLVDGSSCALPNAAGVCAAQNCVLIACEAGFGDCVGIEGCETSLTTTADCGDCGLECPDGSDCQLGPGGFVCAAGVVCPIDRFDLDGDDAHTCEWQASWEEPFALSPVDLEIETVGWADGPLVAGGREDSRISVRLGAAPQPTVWQVPRGDAHAVAMWLDDEHEVVVWSDLITVRRLVDQEMIAVEPECAPASAPRRFVAASGEFVATQFEVFRLDTTCDLGACLELVFGPADYHRQAFAEFAIDELSLCDGCSLALPPECSGPAHCVVESFDPTVCGTCDASTCPTLQIVGLNAEEQRLHIATARGVISINTDGNLEARREVPFDPSGGGGARFVGMVSDVDLALLHSTGYVRVLDSTLAPRFPDLGVDFDPEASTFAMADGVIIAVSGDVVRIFEPGDRSGRTAFVDVATAPGIQGLSPVRPVSTSDGLRLLYSAAGLIYPRLLVRE